VCECLKVKDGLESGESGNIGIEVRLKDDVLQARYISACPMRLKLNRLGM